MESLFDEIWEVETLSVGVSPTNPDLMWEACMNCLCKSMPSEGVSSKDPSFSDYLLCIG